MTASRQKPDTTVELVALRRGAPRPAAQRFLAVNSVLLGLAVLAAALPWIRGRAQGRSVGTGAEVDPYWLKGTFLMVLANAIKWPEQRSKEPFRIVLVRCGNAQVQEIKKAIGDLRSPLGGKPQIVSERNMTGAGLTNLATAHVLFVGGGVGAKDVVEIQKAFSSSPILTVIDDRVEYLRRGYIGAVREQGDKIIVSVSRSNLQTAGLSLIEAEVAPLVKEKRLEWDD